MRFPGRTTMRLAEEICQSKHGVDLKTYLKQETNRGRFDKEIALEFPNPNKPGEHVHRHTVRNWKRLLGIATVKRAVSSDSIR